MKSEHHNELICGLRNIARFLGEVAGNPVARNLARRVAGRDARRQHLRRQPPETLGREGCSGGR